MATIDHHHDAHGHGHAHAPDKRAGFIGLIGGVIVLTLFMYAIVLWTNSRFAGHKAGTPAATQSAAPAGGTPAAGTPAAAAPATGH
jgi:hypothetical protein